MTFSVKEARQEHFNNFDETIRFTEEEQKRIYRLPLPGFLSRGARFQDDESFGVPAHRLYLNDYGFDAICRLAGANAYFLQRLREKGLASRILNDIFLSPSTTRPLDSLELVIDEESEQIIGIVSEKYVGYSNKAFLDDVLLCLVRGNQQPLFPETDDFSFMEAYSVNTRLFMRIKSKHVVGKVTGRGGKGDDVSEIGVEFSNSMNGGHAVRLAYYVYRLICANGLIAKVSGSEGRLVHSGDKRRFRTRLNDKANGILSNLAKAREMIETLGSLTYNSKKIAAHIDLNDVLAVIPGWKEREKIKAAFKERDYTHIKDANERNLCKQADRLDQLPMLLGSQDASAVFNSSWRNNASMYDFINIFTEYAKNLGHAQRLQAEEKAGDLADWITKNKKHFEVF